LLPLHLFCSLNGKNKSKPSLLFSKDGQSIMNTIEEMSELKTDILKKLAKEKIEELKTLLLHMFCVIILKKKEGRGFSNPLL
jgi:hypothetical protein